MVLALTKAYFTFCCKLKNCQELQWLIFLITVHHVERQDDVSPFPRYVCLIDFQSSSNAEKVNRSLQEHQAVEQQR